MERGVWIPTSCLRFKIMDLQPLHTRDNDLKMLLASTKHLKFLSYIYCMVVEVMISLSCQRRKWLFEILIRILVISYNLNAVLKYTSHDLEFQLFCLLMLSQSSDLDVSVCTYYRRGLAWHILCTCKKNVNDMLLRCLLYITIIT